MGLLQTADPAVWLVSARGASGRAGMIASWVTQATLATSRPRLLAVISGETRTGRMIEQTGRFALQLLAEDQQAVVARFALPGPDGSDKWEGFEARRTPGGLPLVDGACGFAECVVSDRLRTGDRFVYLAEIVAEQSVPTRAPLRESRALEAQPRDVADALRRSYALDVDRDEALLANRIPGGSRGRSR